MRFSKDKYMSCMTDNPESWYNKINGKEVELVGESSLLRCDGYFVLKEWCEPINDSDNNDK